jgi:U3 small nucleolar RNA-associated protein 13
MFFPCYSSVADSPRSLPRIPINNGSARQHFIIMEGMDGSTSHAVVSHEPAAPILSKSWAVQTAHVPTFTGGKIRHSSGTTFTAVTAIINDTRSSTDHDQGLSEPALQANGAFLLLPVGGDVAIVDAQLGVKRGTVRGQSDDAIWAQDDELDEDQDGIDADAITAYALAHNDQTIVTCSHSSLLRQYALLPTRTTPQHAKPAQLIKTWGKSGHTLPVTELAFHRSNVFCATGSVDGSARVWDVRGGFCTHVFRPMAAREGAAGGGGSGTLSVTCLSWLPDVTHLVLAVGRDDGSISLYDLRDTEQQQVVVLRDHLSSVTSVEWNAKLDILVTTGRDAVVNLWRIGESPKVDTKKKSKKWQNAGTVSLTYRRIHTLPVYEQVEGMVVLPPTESRRDLVLATAGSKGQIRLWQAKEDEESGKMALVLLVEQPVSESFGEARGGYMNLQYIPLAKPMGKTKPSQGHEFVQEQLVVADAENNISFLSLSEAYLLQTDRTIVGHNDDILDLKAIPPPVGHDVVHVVVATNSAQVRLFDLRNFSCQVLDRHTATVLCVDVSPCGRYVATCGKDKTMRLWSLASQSSVAVATGHTEAIGSTALSRKQGRYDVRGKAATNGGGSFVVTVSMDRTLKRWNLPGVPDLERLGEDREETPLKAFVSVRAHEKDINIVSVAPNDSLVATGSQDKTVKLWKSNDLSLQATLKGHRRGVWDCQFSPHDRILATGSGDRSIKVWSLSDYSCVRTFQGHLASVLRVRFLNGGLQMVSSGADGLVKLWTIRTNECEATMDGHNDKVWALDLAANGTKMISGGADSRIVVWEDTTKADEDARQAEEEEAIVLDQSLANHIRHKEYTQALEIALQRDKPHQALKILSSIVENEAQKGRPGFESLQRHVKGWATERLVQVLRYCREWNTRARNSHIALLVVRAIVSSIPAHKLAATDGVPEILAGIVPYAERHFDRLDKLYAGSYLLDFALFAMGRLDEVDGGEAFATWESSSKLVLPPKYTDGRVQIGGRAIVGMADRNTDVDNDMEEVATVGDSDSSSDEDEDNEENARNTNIVLES